MILATACTVNPTDQVTSVLKKAVAEGKILYGHQDDLMYGHTWNATEESDHTFERSDVLSVAGDYPAILGLELGEIELGGELSLDGVNFDLTQPLISDIPTIVAPNSLALRAAIEPTLPLPETIILLPLIESLK